jgi:cyclopropane-fatty-acyl-phospholipid synthase
MMKHALLGKVAPVSRGGQPGRRALGWVTRRLLAALMSHLPGGAFRVIDWDGTEEQFGEGPPRFCLRIDDPGVVWAILRAVDLGFGEAYMDGRVEVDDLDALLEAAMSPSAIPTPQFPRVRLRLNRPSIRRQYHDVQQHYDRGNAFFALWLDESRTYSCAYFGSPERTLEEAQRAKRRHILRKLQLQPGQTLLDIGCGWGALLFDAAEQFGVHAHGITLSEQQNEAVRGRIRDLGLQERVRVDLADYRELARSGARYDRVVSVGMFEHVGRRNLPAYMEAVARLLKPGGLSLLHTITRGKEYAIGPWIDRYIFPGGYIPSWRETVWLLPESGFELLDAENLRLHYALTLDHWSERFEAHLAEIRGMGCDERFIRMWRLYLRGCATAFRHGDLSLHQLLFSHGRNNALPLTRDHVYQEASRA